MRRTRRTGGRQALRSKGPCGYDCRLGPHLQAKLAMWLDEGSAAHGWSDDQVWAAPRVPTLIGRKFHISYSVSGATRRLHRTGYSVQMPDRPTAERDEEAVAMWREVTWAIPIGAVLGSGLPSGTPAPSPAPTATALWSSAGARPSRASASPGTWVAAALVLALTALALRTYRI